MRRVSVPILALGLLAATPAIGSTLLFNGSFEHDGGLNGASFSELATPGGASWRVFQTLPGWQTSSGGGIEVQTNRTLGSIDAHDGAYYLELDSTGNSAIMQSVSVAAGAYAFGFWYSPRTSNADTNGIAYSVRGASGELAQGEINGPGPSSAVGRWTQVSAQFDVVSAGTITVELRATGRSDSFGGLIDSVGLTSISAPLTASALIPAVPLPPASLLLLAGVAGLGAMGCRARRRRGRARVAS